MQYLTMCINLCDEPTDDGRNIFTHVRPYISDKGASINGPNANEMRKTESVKARRVGFVISDREISPILDKSVAALILYFVPISGNAGAIIELPSGDTNVYNDTWTRSS